MALHFHVVGDVEPELAHSTVYATHEAGREAFQRLVLDLVEVGYRVDPPDWRTGRRSSVTCEYAARAPMDGLPFTRPMSPRWIRLTPCQHRCRGGN